jgi:hypothetical protein
MVCAARTIIDQNAVCAVERRVALVENLLRTRFVRSLRGGLPRWLHTPAPTKLERWSRRSVRQQADPPLRRKAWSGVSMTT